MLLTILKAAFLRIVLQKSVFWLIENCFLVVVSWEKLYFIWWGVREGLYLCVTVYNKLPKGNPIIDLVFDRMEEIDVERFDAWL